MERLSISSEMNTKEPTPKKNENDINVLDYVMCDSAGAEVTYKKPYEDDDSDGWVDMTDSCESEEDTDNSLESDSHYSEKNCECSHYLIISQETSSASSEESESDDADDETDGSDEESEPSVSSSSSVESEEEEEVVESEEEVFENEKDESETEASESAKEDFRSESDSVDEFPDTIESYLNLFGALPVEYIDSGDSDVDRNYICVEVDLENFFQDTSELSDFAQEITIRSEDEDEDDQER